MGRAGAPPCGPSAASRYVEPPPRPFKTSKVSADTSRGGIADEREDAGASSSWRCMSVPVPMPASLPMPCLCKCASVCVCVCAWRVCRVRARVRVHSIDSTATVCRFNGERRSVRGDTKRKGPQRQPASRDGGVAKLCSCCSRSPPPVCRSPLLPLGFQEVPSLRPHRWGWKPQRSASRSRRPSRTRTGRSPPRRR